MVREPLQNYLFIVNLNCMGCCFPSRLWKFQFGGSAKTNCWCSCTVIHHWLLGCLAASFMRKSHSNVVLVDLVRALLPAKHTISGLWIWCGLCSRWRRSQGGESTMIAWEIAGRELKWIRVCESLFAFCNHLSHRVSFLCLWKPPILSAHSKVQKVWSVLMVI